MAEGQTIQPLLSAYHLELPLEDLSDCQHTVLHDSDKRCTNSVGPYIASGASVPHRSINSKQCRWRILRITRAVEMSRRQGMEVKNVARSSA
jgi:hypothetical protein